MPARRPPFSVIILAAGDSTRFGGDIAKQFFPVGGMRLVDHAIDAFRGHAEQIIVALPDHFSNDELISGATPVRGGATRTASVRAALEFVEHDIVLVHDAARPFVTPEIMDRVLDGLSGAMCACPVMPVVNSIVVDENGFLASSPERSSFREAQTPQGFRTDVLREAITRYGEDHVHLPELVRRLGHRVRHTEGSPWLFKLTYAPNIHLAEYYLDRYPTTTADGHSGGS